MTTMEVDIIEEFSNINEALVLAKDRALISKLAEMCAMHELTPEDLANKWDGLKYAAQISDGLNPQKLNQLATKLQKDKDDLAKRERRRLKAKQRKSGGSANLSAGRRVTPAKAQFSGMYDTSSITPTKDAKAMQEPLSGGKRKLGVTDLAESTPTRPHSKSKLNSGETMFQTTPSIQPSPADGKYSNRSNAGQVVSSLHADKKVDWAALAAKKADLTAFDTIHRLDVESLTQTVTQTNFRYMHEAIETKREMINENSERFLNYFSSQVLAPMEVDLDAEGNPGDPEELQSLAMTSQNPVYLGGRVFSTDDDRLTATTNPALEGDLSRSQGHSVNIRLGLLKGYSLFPGQMLCGRGVNASGSSVVLDEICTPPILPKHEIPILKRNMVNSNLADQALTLMMARGPFTPSNNLTYGPLRDFLKQAVINKPDIIVLMGPFVDSAHSALGPERNRIPAKQRFTELMVDVLKLTSSLEFVKIFVQPACSDMSSVDVFPQPALTLDARFVSPDVMTSISKLAFLPNPSLLRINDLTLALNNIDVIRHLSANEVHLQDPNVKNPPKRIIRLSRHMIEQQNLFPVMSPRPNGVNLDYTNFNSLVLPFTPDLIVTPSTRIKQFVANIGDDVVVLNPETLARFDTGGYYALIALEPAAEIPEDGEATAIADRLQVEIKRI